MTTRLKSITVWLLSLCLIMGQLGTAQAAMVGTPSIINPSTQETRVGELQQELQRQEVRAQLEALGVDPAALESRLTNLTDDEIQQLNQQMETLPAGGILGALLVIFIVFVITDAIGATDIFTFVKPVR